MVKINKIINRDALEVELAKRKMSHKDAADLLGISDSTYSLKINQQRDFKETEIYILYKNFGTSIFLK